MRRVTIQKIFGTSRLSMIQVPHSTRVGKMPPGSTLATILFMLFSLAAQAQFFNQTDASATSTASWYGDNWYQLGTGFSGTLQTLTIQCYTSGGNYPSTGSVTLNEFSDSNYSILTNSYPLSGNQCGSTLSYVTFTNQNIPVLPDRYYRLDTSDGLQNASVRLLGTTSEGLAMYDNFVYGTGGVEYEYTSCPYIIPKPGPPPPACPPAAQTANGRPHYPCASFLAEHFQSTLWGSGQGPLVALIVAAKVM